MPPSPRPTAWARGCWPRTRPDTRSPTTSPSRTWIPAVRTANVIASDRGSELPARVPAPAGPRHDLYPVPRSFGDVPLERKIGLLQDLDRFARKADPRVKGVFASLLLENKVVLIASSQGWGAGGPPTAGPLQHPLHRGSRRQAAGRVLRMGRAHDAGRLHGHGAVRGPCPGGGAPGAGEPRGGRGSRRTHGRGPRSGLARHPAPRGHRARTGGRLQPPQDLGLPPGASASGWPPSSARWWTTAPSRLGGAPQRGRRRDADPAHGVDRGRHPARLHARPVERRAAGHGAHRQRAARELRPRPHAAHDQHLHAGRGGEAPRTSSAR